MSVRSGQSVTVEFATSSFTTGAATNADSLPAGTLVVNGADNAASVTVTNVDAGRYKAAVTLPTLGIGDIVELYISATVGGVAGKAIVWRDSKDVLLDSSGDVTFNNTSIATVTNLTNLPAIPNNWLTAAGIAAAALNGKGDWLASSSYPANFGALAITAGGAVTVGTNNDKTGYSLTQAFPANFAALGISVGGHVSNVDTLTTYTGDTPQSGDAYARIGSTGSGLTSLASHADAVSLSSQIGSPMQAGSSVTVGGYAVGEDPATLAWEALASAHDTANTMGALLHTSSAADPLANLVPGTYAAGTAGAALGKIGSGTVAYNGPVNPATGAVSLIQGDVYNHLSPDSNSLDFTNPGNWPDLTGATVAFTIFFPYAPVTFAGSIPVTSGSGSTIRLELTSVQTAAMPVGKNVPWKATVTLSNTHQHTLVVGLASVTQA